MNIKYITCSDPREFNDIHDIVDLGKLSPRVEIAAQAHPSKMSNGMPRNEWFRELLHYVVRDKHDINLAVHVNREWCDEICSTGKIPLDLHEFFNLRDDKNNPIIKRWQLNIPADTVPRTDTRALGHLFETHSDRTFILQYAPRTHEIAKRLYRYCPADFAVLFDESGGRGIAPGEWRAPVFDAIDQGYSGGMSPENVADNLSKILSVQKWPDANIWIDAEGKLKTDDRFNIARARQYVLNAEHWIQKQR